MTTTAIVVAGGRGDRFGSDPPKQFLDLGGEPVIHHCLKAFEEAVAIDDVVVVIPQVPPDWLSGLTVFSKVTAAPKGGPTRQASVGAGLVVLGDQTQVVVVHDAVRPLVRPGLISAVVSALGKGWDGVVPGTAVTEATKEVSSGGEVVRSLRRRRLFTAQTPQAARRSALEDAFAHASAQGWECEDCSEMLLRAGRRVRTVEGDPLNIKITLPEDLERCRQILESRAASDRGGP